MSEPFYYNGELRWIRAPITNEEGMADVLCQWDEQTCEWRSVVTIVGNRWYPDEGSRFTNPRSRQSAP